MRHVAKPFLDIATLPIDIHRYHVRMLSTLTYTNNPRAGTSMLTLHILHSTKQHRPAANAVLKSKMYSPTDDGFPHCATPLRMILGTGPVTVIQTLAWPFISCTNIARRPTRQLVAVAVAVLPLHQERRAVLPGLRRPLQVVHPRPSLSALRPVSSFRT